ncbi:MAG TPA: SSI family serine proteinase inhibitor [Propionibacteriaceae bacterium]|jgi:hypothetical protein
MRLLQTLLIVGLLLISTSCGSSSSPSPAPTSAQPSAQTASVQLTIVATDAAGASVTWTLTCDPAGGTHPDPVRACQALATSGTQALPAVPKDRMCTQVVSGSETATVTGTREGQAVRSQFSRINGCESSRWQALEGLLPRGN